jgi:hypothetical protein
MKLDYPSSRRLGCFYAGILLCLTSGCVSSLRSYHVASPVYPEMRHSFENRYATTDSLQPTLQWKDKTNDATTYEVGIWEAPVKVDYKAKSIPWGTQVYYIENISASAHTVSHPLKPDTIYNWSVRRRRDDKVSAWSTFNQGVSTIYLSVTVRRNYTGMPFGFKTRR